VYGYSASPKAQSYSPVHRLCATNVNSCLFVDVKCGIIQGVAILESCVTNGLYKMFRSKFIGLFPGILVLSKSIIHRRMDKFRTIDSSFNKKKYMKKTKKKKRRRRRRRRRR